jgi:hypothetical protein
MVKKLKYSKIEFVDRTGALMLVDFLDEEGNAYNWAPKWSEVEQVFLKQINVERFNKPDSLWLNKFAKTAQNVVEGAQKINSALKTECQIKWIQDGKILLHQTGAKTETDRAYTPAFDVTIDFLDKWLNRFVEVLIINDLVIRLRFSYQDESGNYCTEDYPPVETPF